MKDDPKIKTQFPWAGGCAGRTRPGTDRGSGRTTGPAPEGAQSVAQKADVVKADVVTPKGPRFSPGGHSLPTRPRHGLRMDIPSTKPPLPDSRERGPGCSKYSPFPKEHGSTARLRELPTSTRPGQASDLRLPSAWRWREALPVVSPPWGLWEKNGNSENTSSQHHSPTQQPSSSSPQP